jgi:hypothetical protein
MSVDSSAGKGTPTFVLQQDGEEITGTYQGVGGKSKVTGKIQGSDFEYRFNSGQFYITYKGKIEGNKVSGSVDFGTSGLSKTARATKGTFTGEKQ